jgi:hypothetical protein
MQFWYKKLITLTVEVTESPWDDQVLLGRAEQTSVVGAASNDSIREPNGGPMLPEKLRPAPGEGV